MSLPWTTGDYPCSKSNLMSPPLNALSQELPPFSCHLELHVPPGSPKQIRSTYWLLSRQAACFKLTSASAGPPGQCTRLQKASWDVKGSRGLFIDQQFWAHHLDYFSEVRSGLSLLAVVNFGPCQQLRVCNEAKNTRLFNTLSPLPVCAFITACSYHRERRYSTVSEFRIRLSSLATFVKKAERSLQAVPLTRWLVLGLIVGLSSASALHSLLQLQRR